MKRAGEKSSLVDKKEGICFVIFFFFEELFVFMVALIFMGTREKIRLTTVWSLVTSRGKGGDRAQ